MKLKSIVFILLLLGVSLVYSQIDPVFFEYETIQFDFNGHKAKIVFPDNPNENRYWIWRARFWGHEPQLDKALLQKGFHVAYVDVSGLYGNQEAVERWNAFYDSTVSKYNLNAKVVLEGMSRGGLIVYNWASQNTDKVFCIYADAPVCDIKSWPGGLYNGQGSALDWTNCLNAYNLDEVSVLAFEGIPLFTCVNVAEAGIPAVHVCGDSDKVVPYEENTKLLAENFRNAGGEIDIILKPGIGHHPHSLEDPTPLVDFILESIQNMETGVKINNPQPVQFELHQNYPNPFNPSTSISFHLPKKSFVDLNIYNIQGVQVKSLIHNFMVAGTHKVQWDARKHPSGLYYYKIEAYAHSAIKKCLLLK